MVYNGQSHLQMDDFGVPLFKEISVGLDMFREST